MIGNVVLAAAAAFGLTVSAVPVAGAADLPRSASIGTNPQGSIFYAVGSVIAAVLSENTPVNVRVQPFTGTTQFVPLIDGGELDFGINNMHDGRSAYLGIAPWNHFPKLRAVTPVIRLQSGMVVRNDSAIETFSDAKGMRITGDYRAHLISRFTTEALMANAGLSWDDFEVVPVSSHVEGVRALMEDRADVVYGAFNPAVREADASIPGGVRFLDISLDPDAVKRMRDTLPGSGVDALPADFFVGIKEPIHVIGYDVYLTSGTEIDDDLVYAMTKVMWEQAEKVKAGHRALAQRFSPDAMVNPDVTFPYHRGAIRFYKEIGLWTEEMDKIQSDLLASQGQSH